MTTNYTILPKESIAAFLKKPSTQIIFVSNLAVALLVIFSNWGLSNILLAYWLENFVLFGISVVPFIRTQGIRDVMKVAGTFTIFQLAFFLCIYQLFKFADWKLIGIGLAILTLLELVGFGYRRTVNRKDLESRNDRPLIHAWVRMVILFVALILIVMLDTMHSPTFSLIIFFIIKVPVDTLVEAISQK